MNQKTTRSKNDLTQTSIDSFILPLKKEKPIMASKEDVKNVINDVEQITTDINKLQQNLSQQDRDMFGHDLNDQRVLQTDKQQQSPLQSCLRSISKFSGQDNAENWLKNVINEFDSLQLTIKEQYELIPDLLIGDAKFWYFKHQDQLTNFSSFFKHFTDYYSDPTLKKNSSNINISSDIELKQNETVDHKDIVMDSIRNQMLINGLEKLSKFSGKSKQNVSKWLKEIQQNMDMFKLTDKEKLFYIPSCLEGDARDWFDDDKHLLLTWELFIQNVTSTFESSGKTSIAFNRLRHYEQGITQDVRQYYFEIMKLCKEANPIMDDASKLQYLLDGLKPSLRFDILLKNPKTPKEFLEYAQIIEQLKSLDEKQNVLISCEDKNFIDSTLNNTEQINRKQRPINPSFSLQQPRSTNHHYKNNYNNHHSSERPTNTTTTQNKYQHNQPKPPYQCYKCGGTDHYIYQCPHFQERSQ